MPCCLPTSLSFDVGVLAMALYGGQEGGRPCISTSGSMEGARAELTRGLNTTHEQDRWPLTQGAGHSRELRSLCSLQKCFVST